VPSIAVNARARWAIGTSNSAYELEANLDGQRYQDVYAVDTKTGQRKVVKKKLRWGNGASPDGSKYLYYENQNFWVYDAETGTDRNITMGMPTSFIDTEDDHNVVDPPTNVVGWSRTMRTCCSPQLGPGRCRRGGRREHDGERQKTRSIQARVRTDPGARR
jgi:hypothetical protein